MAKMEKNKELRQQGFTLVELSIVLIIIGFIIAGVAAGQSLVIQSRLNGVINEVTSYRIAINNFKMQYNALPGDMNNATSFWLSATCPAGQIPSGCNGNGDGIIEYKGATGASDETVRAWQHLSLAGLIPGSFPGTFTTLGQFDIGVNIPASKYPGSGYGFWNGLLYTTSVIENSLLIGGTSTSWHNNYPTFTPGDAYYIDSKIDDGAPKTGSILSQWSDDPIFFAGTGRPANEGCVLGASNKYNLITPVTVDMMCNIQVLLQYK